MLNYKHDEGLQEYIDSVEGLPSFKEYTFWQMLKERKILLNNSIDDDIVERVIIQILKINEMDKNLLPSMRTPVEIYLNTLGGHVDIGLVLCNVIKQSITPVHIIVLGNACSMGALLLMAGHKRFAYQFSNVLVHDGSIYIANTTSKVKDHMKFQEEKEEQIKSFIISNTNISEELYEQKYQSEWWMTAKTAKDLGLIDYIIGE